ncbi:Crp/Fnr family transcriptional regulator [Streptomyces sp. SID8499]|uniref:Crp/Fnr family transcriptional regulator n=1 Tax=Streptomyces sp. SID8499 TaxID=2706106 RepID=UPI0013C6E134|nr:Crp/Fnr family transcriptional regulator [Streptomyces sp. SID8499]NED35623.1 Crp/Fnr family transcriptional regulator [Streptomyces sp. SID8499]
MTHRSHPNGRAAFLDTLSHEARAAFAQLGTRRHYAVGDVLIREGDLAQELVVLQDGLVKVTRRLEGGRVALVDIKIAGDIVGEIAAMDLGPRSATVTACGEVAATVIRRDELEPFLCANPEAWKALSRMLCGRLRRSDRRRLEFGEYPVVVRLARVLVELAASYGQSERNSLRIDVNLTQSEFAALTGCRTHTVHKALARLRNEDIISTGSRRIYVRDLPRLQKAARLSVPAA